LDGAGVLPKISNCARLQVDGFAKEVRRVTDQDLDQEGGQWPSCSPLKPYILWTGSRL
jgi:hypothetical protein